MRNPSRRRIFAVFKNVQRSERMQRKKDDIGKCVEKEAKKIFLKKGFAKTSMREIAEKLGVGLSNIYNYYVSKDDLFCSIVAPVVNEFKEMIDSYHNPKNIDITLGYDWFRADAGMFALYKDNSEVWGKVKYSF